MEQIDCNEILGVTLDASQKQIKEAYRKIALQYHPYRNKGNPESNARMKAINEAYAVLSNPSKRGDYDASKREFGCSAYKSLAHSFL